MRVIKKGVILSMGLMNKLSKMKSFLFDEEDEEKEVRKPSKKIVKREEEKEDYIDDLKTNIKPKKIEKVEDFYFEDVSEEETPKMPEVHSRSERADVKFNFQEFDDEDFMVSSKRPEPIIPVKKEEPKRVLYQGSKRKEETKKFKPSPIISPIYGLLDEEGNHVKEEESKTDKAPNYNDEVSFDEVRKKAYGALDEEIENTMKRLSKKTIEEAEKDMEKEDELSREKKNTKVKEEKPVVASFDDDDDDDDMILPNVNFKEIDVDKEKDKPKHKKNDKKHEEKNITSQDEDDDDTKEQDLFNLIDTMYQNKEDED